MGEEETNRGSLWTWIGVGCGGLLFLGVAGSCVGPAIFGMMMAEGLGAFGGGMPSVAPLGGAGGVHTGLDLPDPPGPIAPVGNEIGAEVAVASFLLEVTEATEVPGVSAGTRCPLEVRHVRRTGDEFWCQTELSCGGQRLYGGPGQGFFPCTWPTDPEGSLEGWDLEQSAADGDPSFVIETDGTATLEDGAWTLVGTLRPAPKQEDAFLPAPGPPPGAGAVPAP